jgi:hypothetical protein
MCGCKKVDAPLTAVIGPAQLRTYRQVFHLLWRLKRGDFVLSACWRQHMGAAKARLPVRLPALAKHVHQANLVRRHQPERETAARGAEKGSTKQKEERERG